VTTPTPRRHHVRDTDASTAVTGGSRAGSEPSFTLSPRRVELELAQRVWQRSLELTSAGAHLRLPDQALMLARAARHDADTMAHALRLGRSRARHPSHDETTGRGIRLLEQAIAYLGVKTEHGEIARTGPHPVTMPGCIEPSMDDDDLSRQRRKREARLLDRQLPDIPGVTVADVVADVLAASDEGPAPLDVPGYLAEGGHTWTTITNVVDYLDRHCPPLRAAQP
jgi:hypothetical protein